MVRHHTSALKAGHRGREAITAGKGNLGGTAGSRKLVGLRGAAATGQSAQVGRNGPTKVHPRSVGLGRL